jgi:hypothetical protein
MLAFSNGTSASTYEKRTGRSSHDMSLKKKGLTGRKKVEYSINSDLEQPLVTEEKGKMIWHLPVICLLKKMN